MMITQHGRQDVPVSRRKSPIQEPGRSPGDHGDFPERGVACRNWSRHCWRGGYPRRILRRRSCIRRPGRKMKRCAAAQVCDALCYSRGERRHYQDGADCRRGCAGGRLQADRSFTIRLFPLHTGKTCPI